MPDNSKQGSVAEDEQLAPSSDGIPIRNLWFLLMYAADLAKFIDRFDSAADGSAEIVDLLARLLADVVRRRLQRNLSRGYRPYRALLMRVRGRIDFPATFARNYTDRGQVVCRFEELTVDTPRNRLARAALERIARSVHKDETAHDCRSLARIFSMLGVSEGRPSPSELRRDQVARNESDDRLMVAVAQLALDLVLPSEAEGERRVTRLERHEALLRKIFEKAVAGFYRHELGLRRGWHVRPELKIDWPAESATPGLRSLLPGMIQDIVLSDPGSRRYVVIDTKFTRILTANRFGEDMLRNPHLYQIYSYLSSQSDYRAGNEAAEGILLYPASRYLLDEAVTIQGHRMRFATVDLASTPQDIRDRLLEIVLNPI